MRASMLARAALVLLCAAGIVLSLISYGSQKNLDEGLHRAQALQLDDRTRDLLEDSRTLNPDVRAEQSLSFVLQSQGREWEPLIRRALEREPENVGVLGAYSLLLANEGRTAESSRAYDRASELDPQRFPPRPGGGG